MKTCPACLLALPLDAFYSHPRAKDGYFWKCKECHKRAVRENRAAKREQYAEYERERFMDPARREQAAEAQRRRRARFPEKERARRMVSYWLRTGKMLRLPCLVCGDPKPEAHHEDYSKPLDVTWLCFRHHREAHGQVVVTAKAA